ncbi:MAG: efflux RND transporter periplasmic adaptor subunit [Gammaproteobacteria bacterium]|nr:efflux RND transporter periplasmic adaptor subunit [Gammaproteobacteria bacterium]
MNNNNLGITRALIIAALPLWLAACGGDDVAEKAPPLPVQVAEVQRRDVPLIIEMVGSTLGTQDVPIRARVEGFLESMNFREGAFVDEGQLLYTIDPQPFQAKLVEAQSQLAAAQTNLAKAESDLGRIRPLAEMKAVSAQDLDSAVAQFDAARAGVQAAKAAVDLAEIELSYTRIRAPITGLIGLSKAKPGEFVGREPNPVVLNVLSDIDPIRVRFSISEREYLILARGAAQEDLLERREPDTRVELILLLADGSEFPHRGFGAGAAQAIDPETGTFTVEALFPNPDNILLPGQFARVRAPYTELKNAVVVPRRAVTELQGRFRVYVVNSNNEVEVREITPGPIKNNLQVVEAGLNGGERIIVEGLQKVRPGMVVAPTLRQEATPQAPIQAT